MSGLRASVIIALYILTVPCVCESCSLGLIAYSCSASVSTTRLLLSSFPHSPLSSFFIPTPFGVL